MMIILLDCDLNLVGDDLGIDVCNVLMQFCCFN